MKALVKKALWAIGYEIHQRQLPDPQLSQPEDSVLTDEVIAGPWVSSVLEMSNRYYRPHVLQYHRSKFGDDKRLKYVTTFLDVRDQRILEIGPCEGHHSIVLEKLGVRENIAIESRIVNLHKCQRIKEKYHLDHTIFVRADLESLCKGEDILSFSGQFDLVFCLGVLYHLPDPGRGLEWMLSQGNTLFLGTHYGEENRFSGREISYNYHDRVYRALEQVEGGIDDPISGMSPTSLRLYEDDLLRLIRDVGYSRISVLGKDLHNNDPHITLLAEA